MKSLRIDASEGVSPPLFEITWEQDRQNRMSSTNVTALLREQVPVLEFVDWTVTAIEPGVATSVLPLNPQSTNQHFTHQAALFVLAGDYTGGTALASLLTGWPVVGVHPVCSPKSVSMWLLRVEIKYMRPSVTDLTVSARIDPQLHERIQKRFMYGQTVIEAITIEFRNGETVVGEATMTYFARQSEKLRTDGISTERVNSLYELKLTSSAELIAGVRAAESGRLYRDDYAEQMAGQHGMAWHERFCERSPQLAGMVVARGPGISTRRSRTISRRVGARRGDRGKSAGTCARSVLVHPAGTRIYELDFPTTLAERARRLQQLGLVESAEVARRQIPIDLRTMPLAPVLAEHLDFERPVFVAWEGMSMYFQEPEVRQILAGMAPALRHPDSLLWVDLVDRAAVEHPEEFGPSVSEFMRGMQILGEPFTFGPASIEEFMHGSGLRSLEVVPSDVCLNGRKDPVYGIYKFCMVSAEISVDTRVPATFRKTRIDRRSRGIARMHVPNVDQIHSPRKPPRLERRERRGKSAQT